MFCGATKAMRIHRGWGKSMTDVDLGALVVREEEARGELLASVGGGDGWALLERYASWRDVLLGDVHGLLGESGVCLPASKVEVYATGGYGMGLVCPWSDVDLLVVYDPVCGEEELSQISGWSRALRGAFRKFGLKTGIAHRTPGECLSMASEDLSIATSMLYARKLWGDRASSSPVGVLGSLVASELRGEDQGRGFARRVWRGCLERHDRFGRTVRLLEPDVKFGRGGVRDLQALLWSARVLHGSTDLRGAAWSAGASEDETLALEEAAGTLLRFRMALHLVSSRFGFDRLMLPKQKELVALFGFEGTTVGSPGRGLLATERLMQEFYRAADLLATCALRWQELWLLPEPDLHPVRVDRGLCVRQGRVDLLRQVDQPEEGELLASRGELQGVEAPTDTEVPQGLDELAREARVLLRRNPMVVHEMALELGLPLHPVVDAHLARLSHGARSGEEVMLSFRRVLCSLDTPEELQTSLVRSGLFGLLLPEFGPITALAQHDVYHVYTVDAHLFKSLSLGRRVLREGFGQKGGKVWHVLDGLARSVPSHRWDVFLLSCLLHDVGKGRGGDHSILGEELAGQIGPRLRLTSPQTRRLGFLIREHLLLPQVSQRRDLNDDNVVREVALKVRTLPVLEDLVLLSAVDMMAVGPENLTEWKAQLLVSLYLRIKHVLEEGLDVLWRVGEQIAVKKGRIASHLGLLRGDGAESVRSREKMEVFFGSLSERYLLRTPEHILTRHLSLVISPEETAMEVRLGELRGSLEVSICTGDGGKTLSDVAGALAAEGMNILHAETHAMSDGRVFLLFLVQGNRAQRSYLKEKQERVRRRIVSVFNGEVDLETLIQERRKRGIVREMPFIKTRIRFDEKLDQPYTVIEVRTQDRLGLLWEILRCLYDAGSRVRFAKIATEGARVIDSFYVDRAEAPHGRLTKQETRDIETLLSSIAGVESC